jgi:hypothetical protein
LTNLREMSDTDRNPGNLDESSSNNSGGESNDDEVLRADLSRPLVPPSHAGDLGGNLNIPNAVEEDDKDDEENDDVGPGINGRRQGNAPVPPAADGPSNRAQVPEAAEVDGDDQASIAAADASGGHAESLDDSSSRENAEVLGLYCANVKVCKVGQVEIDEGRAVFRTKCEFVDTKSNLVVGEAKLTLAYEGLSS